MDQQLKYKSQTIKFLGENIGQNLHDTELGSDFLDMAPQAQEKEKINKLDLVKMKKKKMCAAKDSINRIKRQPTEQEKMFANHLSDERLISRIHEEFLQLNNKKANNPI